MKRDDMGMRIDDIRKLATKYSKQDLQRMVQMGMIDAQKAVMAGMMIDRITQSATKPPETTVAEDVLGGAPTTAQGQIPPDQMGQEQMPPQMPPPMAAGGGLMGMMPHSDGMAALHSGLHDMAGGGIVAFADGGIPSYAGDKGSYIDSEFMTKDPKKIKEAQYQILAQELKSQLEAVDSSEGEDKLRAIKNVEAIRREMRAIKPKQSDDEGIAALIPSAQAAEVKPRTHVSGPAQAKAEAAKAAALATPTAEEEASYDPMTGVQISGPSRAKESPMSSMGAADTIATMVDPSYKPYTPTAQAALPPIAKPSAPKPKDTIVNSMKPDAAAPEVAAPEEKAAMGPERPSIIDRAIGNLRDISIEKPVEKTIQSVAKEQAEADAIYGVDNKKMFDDLRKDYKESGGNLKQRADKAAGMALVMFGVGLAGARKGQEWQTASESGQKALSSYMGAMDKINDNEEKLKQRMQDLTMAENQFNRSRSDKALSEVQTNKREIKSIEMENAKLQSHAITEGAKITIDYFKNTNPPAYQYLQKIVDEQRARGNKNYTLVDALKDDKTGGARGEVTDKELQDDYAKLRDGYMGKKQEEFLKKYPTWRHYADAQGKSGSRLSPSSTGAVDKSNPLLAN